MKKSDPRMGLETSANVKEWETLKEPKLRRRRRVPKVLIEDPFAARSTPDARRDSVAGEAGNTERSAPESMRKGRCRRRQKRDKDPEEEMTLTEGRVPGEVIVSRPARFPGQDAEAGGRELGEDGPGPSYDRLKDRRTYERCGPNERGCCRENAVPEEVLGPDPDHVKKKKE